MLCEGHAPDLARLPEFILGLAHDVNWEEEKSCFRHLRKNHRVLLRRRRRRELR